MPTRNKAIKQKQQRNKTKNKTNVGKAMRAVGGIAGGYLGGPTGAALGQFAGGWLSKITGNGDYKVRSNTIGTTGVPSFSPDKDGIRVCHREFITNVTTSTAFQIQRAFTINPGLQSTFPWLSALAQSFEEYELLGLVFSYQPTSSTSLNSVNPAQGVVIAATHYNVLRPPFEDKISMESYEYSCSSAPYNPMMHPVECKPSANVLDRLFVRTSDTAPIDDPRFYDAGRFEIATEGMQTSYTCGELWVTYDIRLFKPRLPNPTAFLKVIGFTPSAALPLGSPQVINGDLSTPITYAGSGFSYTLDLTNYPPGDYYFWQWCQNTINGVLTMGTPNLSGVSFFTDVFDGISNFRTPSGSTVAEATTIFYFRVPPTIGPKTIIFSNPTFASGTPLKTILIIQRLSQRPLTRPLAVLSNKRFSLIKRLGKHELADFQEIKDPDNVVEYINHSGTEETLITSLIEPERSMSVASLITEPDAILKLLSDLTLT